MLEGFWVTETVGGAWVHAPPPMKAAKLVDRERLLLICLPTLSVRTTVTCNKGNNAQTAVDFNFIFLLGSGSFSTAPFSFRFPFFSVSSGLLWGQGVCGLWSAGSVEGATVGLPAVVCEACGSPVRTTLLQLTVEEIDGGWSVPMREIYCGWQWGRRCCRWWWRPVEKGGKSFWFSLPIRKMEGGTCFW
jgi:hypothetical protein